ncbi:MAG TPA: alkaline phosphatase family protein [Longimicrobiales bacterium]|nr:alkaline phosphatase family protein [Longimicrobiales bacterium]
MIGLLVGLIAIEWLRPTIIRRVGGPIQTVAEALTPGLSRHVVIVSIDGLRPDAIARYDAPTLQRLVATGRYTLRARTVVPSKTLPAHTSMLTGASLEQHGVSWNEPLSDSVLSVPTIFERARRHGLVTAAFFSKPKMEMLASGSGYDYVQRPVGGLMGMLGGDVHEDVRALLREEKPHLLFVHIGDPDYIGHITGWMTPFYGNAVARADDALEEIITVADSAYGVGEYTLIVTADHGGHGRDHTGPDPVDVHIPWIVAGKGVRGSGELRSQVRVFDTGPTALWLLGIRIDASLAGRPVREAFEAATAETVAQDSVAGAGSHP